MKKKLTVLASIFLSGRLFAGAPPPAIQDSGSVSTGTLTTVRVTTTPALAYSTGTFKQGVTLSTVATWGQYLPNRVNLEFFNDTSTDVWIGYQNYVSTIANDSDVNISSYGRRIPPGAAWSPPGSIKDYWLVAATTTLKKFITIQEK